MPRRGDARRAGGSARRAAARAATQRLAAEHPLRAREPAARTLRIQRGAGGARRPVRPRVLGRAVAGAGALLVYPRLVRLGPLFSESGERSQNGRRLLLRRNSGFELHSVREYEQGESLRRVHWPSTARRAQLMVKELEDSPRDEIAVVLDADREAVVGRGFEVQVRAAGSILDAYVRRGRRAVLVVNSERRDAQHVHSPGADWRRALELLAAVEPTGEHAGGAAPARGRQSRGTGARARGRDGAPRAATRRPARSASALPSAGLSRLRRRGELQRRRPPCGAWRCCAWRPRGRRRRDPRRRQPRRVPRRRVDTRMPHMLKTVALSAAAALVIAVDWLRFEEPRSGGGRPFVLAALAIGSRAAAAALAAACRRRACGADRRQRRVLALLLALWPGGDGFFGPIGSRFSRGFLDFYDFRLPIDPTTHPPMHAVILIAIFGFTLAVALAVACAPRAPGRRVLLHRRRLARDAPFGGERARSRYRNPRGARSRCSPA